MLHEHTGGGEVVRSAHTHAPAKKWGVALGECVLAKWHGAG